MINTDTMCKATESRIQKQFEQLLAFSEDKSNSIDDRLDAAFFAGKLQVALHYESVEMLDYCQQNEIIIKKLLAA